MQTPPTTLVNGVPVPALPPGCPAFPARAGYPESWTLHVLAVDAAGETRIAVRGTLAGYANEYVRAAMEHGADVFAWVTDADEGAA